MPQVHNRVEELKEEILKIQASCSHQFHAPGAHVLPVSSTPGVYIVQDFSASCVLCSLEDTYSAMSKCPKCLGLVAPKPEATAGSTPGHMDFAGDMIKYFGRDEPYQVAKRRECSNCGLQLVYKEYDR